MKVEEVISGINSKELKVQQLADKYGCSSRTVQSRIKRLGYVWNARAAHYEFTGEDEESIKAIEFDSFFNSNNNAVSTIINNAKTTAKTAAKPAANDTSKKADAAPHSTNRGTNSDKTPVNAAEPDYIDLLLNGNKRVNSRVYRGYYFDKDILNILDRASNKSELLNAILRAEFKRRGLL